MFTYHSIDTAPSESHSHMERSEKKFGFLPKLQQVMAEAPATIGAYNILIEIFQAQSTLTSLEQQVVFMTANRVNRCHYCTAGHSMLMTVMKMPQEHIAALREGEPLADVKLEALRQFTKDLLETRGHVGDDKLRQFLGAGYNRRQALEVLTGLAAKLISNFTNALAHTDLDDPVKPFAWAPVEDRQAAAG